MKVVVVVVVVVLGIPFTHFPVLKKLPDAIFGAAYPISGCWIRATHPEAKIIKLVHRQRLPTTKASFTLCGRSLQLSQWTALLQRIWKFLQKPSVINHSKFAA